MSVEAFGCLAVLAMVTTYALERRSPFFILAFSASCVAAAVRCPHPLFPLRAVEALWSVVAFQR